MTEPIATSESGMLDKPCRRHFMTLLKRRIAWDRQLLRRRSRPEVVVLRCGEHWVFEERPCTLRVRIAVDNQHAFAGTDVAHGFPRLRQSGSIFASFEMPLEIRILKMRR